MLSLDLLRLKHLAVEMYKCVNGMNPAYLNDTFSIKETAYDLRDTSVLNQNSFKTRTYVYRSFAYYGSKLWNCLPNGIKSAPDVNIYKGLLVKWLKTGEAKRLVIH